MNRRKWWDLLWLLLIALALRLVLWVLLERPALVSDEPEYLAAASWLAQGRGFSFYDAWPWLRPPLYLLFLAPFLRVFGFTLTPIRLAQVALSLLVPALVYLLAYESFRRRVAWVAGLLAALWLPLAGLPHLVLAENLFLPLLLGAVWCLVRYQKTDRRPLLLVGGALLGLATLTKGMTIGYLPLAALWVWGQSGFRRRAPAIGRVALLLGAALVVILPWTAWNTLRYGRPVLVDTTGGYNFWLGSAGGQFENARQVHQDLLAISDPAGRQAYAYRQGMEAITADPGGFLRGRVNEVGQLLRINYGADERLVDGFVLGQVPASYLVLLFLLEDAAYVALAPLALVGLLMRKGEAGRGLVLLWTGYNLLLAVAFFAISRFRLPLLPFLAIYAASAVVERPWWNLKGIETRAEWRAYLLRLGAALLLLVLFWIVVLPSFVGPYPASSGATLLGLRGRQTAGSLQEVETALDRGDLQRAEEALEEALRFRPDGVHPVVTAQVALAEWRRARGLTEAALRGLEGLDWYQAYLLRGDILRAQGELAAARAQFSAREVDARNPTRWAWEHLQPPPSETIDLGDDLDLGLVDGFHLGERDGQTTFRWSAEVARLRFPAAGTGQPQTLTLRLRGWRPEGEPPPELTLFYGDLDPAEAPPARELLHIFPPGEWTELAVPLPAARPGEDVVVTLWTNPFLAGPRDLLATGRLRFLGLMVESGGVE